MMKYFTNLDFTEIRGPISLPKSYLFRGPGRVRSPHPRTIEFTLGEFFWGGEERSNYSMNDVFFGKKIKELQGSR